MGSGGGLAWCHEMVSRTCAGGFAAGSCGWRAFKGGARRPFGRLDGGWGRWGLPAGRAGVTAGVVPSRRARSR